MKLLKKITMAALALCMAGTMFAACGNKDNDDANAAAFESELGTKGKIVIGISADYPPYENLTATGEIEGFDVDMMNEVAKYLKEGGIDVEFKNMDFSTIVSAVQTGSVDVGVSAFTYDPERDVQFSTPYLTSQQMVVVTKESGITSIDQLKGKKIGAGTGTTGEAAAKENIEDCVVSSPGDYNIMFEALANGALDAVVCDGLVAKNNAENKDLVVLTDPLIDEENSIIVKNGNNELLKAINAAIEKFVTSDKYNELQVKWGIIAE